MATRIFARKLYSFKMDVTHEVPHYYIQPGQEIELRVIGTNFTVPMFQRLPRGASNMDGQIVEAYMLVYQYISHDTAQLIAHPALFIGGKPCVQFLYEDKQYPNSPIVELGLFLLRNKPILLPIHMDAENDPKRTHINDFSSYRHDESSLEGDKYKESDEQDLK